MLRQPLLSALASVSIVGTSACGEAWPNYLETPRCWAQDPSRFAALLESGHRGVLRIALFGDSQETSPGGAGAAYVPNLNYRLWQRYGHVGETLVMSNTTVGGGVPSADWLWVGAVAPPGSAPSELPPAQILPNVFPRSHHLSGTNGQVYGTAALLAYDGSLTADSLLPIQPYFAGHLAGHRVRAEVLVAASAPSGGVTWKAVPRSSPTIDYFAPSSGGGVLPPPLAEPEYTIQSTWTADLEFAGHPFIQVELSGASAALSTEIVGVRFVDIDAHRGAVVQSFGKGGYCTREVLLNHMESGPMLAAIAPTAAVLHFGVNDVVNGVDAAGFRRDTEQLINWIRGAVGDPELPVILVGDLWQKNMSPAQEAAYATFPGVAWSIAQADPNVASVNLRRLAEEAFGWGPSTSWYLIDNVHLSVLAQRWLAQLLVDSVFAWAFGCDEADLDGDGVVGGGDLGLMLSNWGPGARDPTGCGAAGDLNADGAVDGSDLGILLAAWTEPSL
jgi:lysophospholipase L1-like esterase